MTGNQAKDEHDEVFISMKPGNTKNNNTQAPLYKEISIYFIFIGKGKGKGLTNR